MVYKNKKFSAGLSTPASGTECVCVCSTSVTCYKKELPQI